MLKKLVSALATISLGICILEVFASNASKAEGTWILVHKEFSKMKPGSIGEYLNMGGFAWWVDARSIVKRADIAYFNVSTMTLDKNGNFPRKRTYEGIGWSANCATRKVRVPNGEWHSWGTSNDDLFYSVGKIVCD